MKVWSVLITIFGDCIVPRGGRICLSSLQQITAPMNLEANAIRTALSRLAKDGWLDRRRHGRQTSYALQGDGKMLFERAEERIYANGVKPWTGEFEILVQKGETANQRAKARKNLLKAGFGVIGSESYIRPCFEENGLHDGIDGYIFRGIVTAGRDARQMAIEAWPFDELNAAYDEIHKRFQPFSRLQQGELSADPLASLVLRILLVHEWRRVVLRDVDLPLDYKPPGWLGEKVRAMVADLYLRLVEASERFLDTLEAEPGRNLPPATTRNQNRFKK